MIRPPGFQRELSHIFILFRYFLTFKNALSKMWFSLASAQSLPLQGETSELGAITFSLIDHLRLSAALCVLFQKLSLVSFAFGDKRCPLPFSMSHIHLFFANTPTFYLTLPLTETSCFKMPFERKYLLLRKWWLAMGIFRVHSLLTVPSKGCLIAGAVY